MNNVSVAHPELLMWGIPVLVIAAGINLTWFIHARRRHGSLGVGVASLTRAWSASMAWTRWGMTWCGLLLLLLAAAGPRWGNAVTERTARGSNLVLLLDCSRSMLAEDLYPNRIEAARRKAIDLLETAPEHRMALMPFAAIAVLRCPLSGDRLALEAMLRDCSPDLFPVSANLQGTAIGAAVENAIDILSDSGDRGRAIVVCSDGSDPDSERVEAAAELARSAGIPVYGLFLGDPDVETSLVLDGREVPMQAERDSLSLLADRTGAICVNATSDRSDVQALADHIATNVDTLEWQERSRTMATERYLWPLIPGIALVAMAAFLPTRRPRRQMEVQA